MKFLFVHHGFNAMMLRWNFQYITSGLRELGHSAETVVFQEHKNKISESDVVVYYRLHVVDTCIIDTIRETSRTKLTLYSVDDLVFLPNDYTNSQTAKFVRDCMEVAHGLLVSTTKLQQICEKVFPNKPVIVRGASIDMDTFNKWTQLPAIPSQTGFRIGVIRYPMYSRAERIYKSLLDDLSFALPAIETHFIHPDNAAWKLLSGINKQTYRHDPTPLDNPDSYYQLINNMRLNAVINLLPTDDDFYHCKGPLKFIETACIGVPLITSRTLTFTEIIKDAHNGLFGDTISETIHKIRLLSTGKIRSDVIVNNARKTVLDSFLSTHVAQKLVDDCIQLKKVFRK